MTFIKISLIRVRWPAPLDFSQARTRGSSRRLTGTLASLAARSRTIFANCSSLKRGMSSTSMCESSSTACRAAILPSVLRSSLVHRLFLIATEFVLFGRAGRDDTDRFLAINILPIGVHDQQHRVRKCIDSRAPDCMPSNLSTFFVNTLRVDKAMRIFKNEGRQFERNAAVFSLIPFVLALAPFVAHSVYT